MFAIYENNSNVLHSGFESEEAARRWMIGNLTLSNNPEIVDYDSVRYLEVINKANENTK